MSLPRTDDEAALRALNRKCADPKSLHAKRFLGQLSAQSLAYKTFILNSSCVWGLGNLVRCALEAQVSPETRTLDVPVLVLAAHHGATPALKALLVGGANKEQTDNRGFTASPWPLDRDTCRVCNSFSTPGRTQTRKRVWVIHRY